MKNRLIIFLLVAMPVVAIAKEKKAKTLKRAAFDIKYKELFGKTPSEEVWNLGYSSSCTTCSKCSSTCTRSTCGSGNCSLDVK